jgi:hypothetical protein
VVGAAVVAGAQPAKNELSIITANMTDITDLVRILILYSPQNIFLDGLAGKQQGLSKKKFVYPTKA